MKRIIQSLVTDIYKILLFTSKDFKTHIKSFDLFYKKKKKRLPLLKFTSGPFKLMVIMSKSRLSWEEAVKLVVRGGYYNEGGVKKAKH